VHFNWIFPRIFLLLVIAAIGIYVELFCLPPTVTEKIKSQHVCSYALPLLRGCTWVGFHKAQVRGKQTGNESEINIKASKPTNQPVSVAHFIVVPFSVFFLSWALLGSHAHRPANGFNCSTCTAICLISLWLCWHVQHFHWPVPRWKALEMCGIFQPSPARRGKSCRFLLFPYNSKFYIAGF